MFCKAEVVFVYCKIKDCKPGDTNRKPLIDQISERILLNCSLAGSQTVIYRAASVVGLIAAMYRLKFILALKILT